MSSSAPGTGLKPFTLLKPHPNQSTIDSDEEDHPSKAPASRPSLSILQPIQTHLNHSLSPIEPTTSSLSRASSAKSTSSVQAVPIKIPIRSTPSRSPPSKPAHPQPSNLLPSTQFISALHLQPSDSISESAPTPAHSAPIYPLSSLQTLTLNPPSTTTSSSSYSLQSSSSNHSSPSTCHPPPSTSAQIPKRLQDLILGDVLGEGSYSTVYHAVDKLTRRNQYALKVLDKRHIQKEKKVKYVAIERDCLNILHDHPGCITLFSTFQDEHSLYYLLEYVPNGEILKLIKSLGSLSTGCARFYSAQILTAIEHIHNRGVVHRDIKPENILLDSKMRIKIADYGSAKILTDANPNGRTHPPTDTPHQRSHSFVGTADYVSPELLIDKVTGKSSDLWAFACVLFQLIASIPPFRSRSEYLTFQKIINLDYQFPEGFPSDAEDLISKLLVLNPQNRFCLEEIKAHYFYESVAWDKIWQVDPPVLQSGIIKPPDCQTNILAAFSPIPSTQIPSTIKYPTQDFYQEPTTFAPALPRDWPRLTLIGKGDDDNLHTEDGRMLGSDGQAVSKQPSWILNATRKRSKDDAHLVSNSNEMTWVDIFLPNELMIYSSPVNELIMNEEEVNHLNDNNNTNINHRIKSFTWTLSQKNRRKKKKRVLILTNFPRLLCVKEDEKKSNKVRIKYEILFKPLPTLPTTTTHTSTETPMYQQRLSSLDGFRSDLAIASPAFRTSAVSPHPSASTSSHQLPKQHKFLLFKKIEIENSTTFKIETVKSASSIIVPPSQSNSPTAPNTSRLTSTKNNNINSKKIEAHRLVILRFEDKSNDDGEDDGDGNNDDHAVQKSSQRDDQYNQVRRWCDEINLAFRVANHLDTSDADIH